MSLSIRQADPSECSQIAEIWFEGWHSGHAEICPPELTALRTRENFATRARDHLARTNVAVRDGQVIGFYMIKETELYQFYVASAGRGTGVAADLMADAECSLKEIGVSRPWLACSIGNERAARFYEKSGWVRVGTVVEDLEVSTGSFSLEVWRYEKQL